MEGPHKSAPTRSGTAPPIANAATSSDSNTVAVNASDASTPVTATPRARPSRASTIPAPSNSPVP